MKNNLLSPADVVRLYPISSGTLWRETKSGGFPTPIKVGKRKIFYPKDAVDAYFGRSGGEATPKPVEIPKSAKGATASFPEEVRAALVLAQDIVPKLRAEIELLSGQPAPGEILERMIEIALVKTEPL